MLGMGVQKSGTLHTISLDDNTIYMNTKDKYERIEILGLSSKCYPGFCAKEIEEVIDSWIIPSYKHGRTRYDSVGYSEYTFCLSSKDIKNISVGLDIPILIHTLKPRVGTIAIVGEAPSRPRLFKDDLYEEIVSSLSVGLPFGQHDAGWSVAPRVYDMLISWYLDAGFDVYLTNLSKWIYGYKLNRDGAPIYEKDNQTIIDTLEEEFMTVKKTTGNLNHIIWLGDAQWKRFIYGESVRNLHTDYTIFPHPSGANGAAWKKLLKEKECTKENKVEYMVKNANVLYRDGDSFCSTIPLSE